MALEPQELHELLEVIAGHGKIRSFSYEGLRVTFASEEAEAKPAGEQRQWVKEEPAFDDRDELGLAKEWERPAGYSVPEQ